MPEKVKKKGSDKIDTFDPQNAMRALDILNKMDGDYRPIELRLGVDDTLKTILDDMCGSTTGIPGRK